MVKNIKPHSQLKNPIKLQNNYYKGYYSYVLPLYLSYFSRF